MNKICDRYDVIIIGAGIGGLVCGCYLAKGGLKVLIVEKNPQPGGYCTSFRRKGFIFDSAVRGLVGCGEKNILGRILKEIDVYEEIKMFRVPVFDKIITPDFNISIKSDYKETKDDLKTIFPQERHAIENFFKFLNSTNFFQLYSILGNKSFQELLDSFFLDRRLKSVWNVMRSDTGLVPSKTSALAGLSLCRGYIFDGGYYPKGGMQTIPDKLLRAFKENGGEVIFSREAEKIIVKNGRAEGVILNGNIIIMSKTVVSACDATQTFLRLVNKRFIKKNFKDKIKEMKPSPSVFIVYLGLKKRLNRIIRDCCSIWYFPDRPSSKDYDIVFKNNLRTSSKYVVCVFPSLHDRSLSPETGESVYLYVGAPFKNEYFWKQIRQEMVDDIISRASEIIPDLKSSIDVVESATPQTLYRYTYNREGASRGWAALIDQTKFDVMPYETQIKGLFLSGHWVTFPTGQGGIAMAAYAGKSTAKIILRNKE